MKLWRDILIINVSLAGIFLLKNHFGYKDQQETIITPNMTMGEEVDTNEMKMKYLDKIVDEDD